MQFEIVTNPYPVSASPLDDWSADGIPSIVVRGDWSTEVEDYVRKKKVEDLYLNIAKGWAGNDYRVLGGLEWLKLLSILTGKKIDLAPVSQLLILSQSIKSLDSISHLTNLQKLELNRFRNLESLQEIGLV